MSGVAVQGREAFVAMLRFVADQIEAGAIDYPISVAPAPHLGPFYVRLGGVDYDMADGLPGVVPDPADDQTPITVPGKGKKESP